jgi:hypothetical protein
MVTQETRWFLTGSDLPEDNSPTSCVAHDNWCCRCSCRYGCRLGGAPTLLLYPREQGLQEKSPGQL